MDNSQCIACNGHTGAGIAKITGTGCGYGREYYSFATHQKQKAAHRTDTDDFKNPFSRIFKDTEGDKGRTAILQYLWGRIAAHHPTNQCYKILQKTGRGKAQFASVPAYIYHIKCKKWNVARIASTDNRTSKYENAEQLLPV